MKKLLSLFIILMMFGCSADDGTSSNNNNEPNNILTGTWIYTYSITTQRNDTFELNAAGGVMTGYFNNSHYGDYLTLYGTYDETTMGFTSINYDENIKYNLDATYTNNSMTGTMQVLALSGELQREVPFTAVKQ